MGRITGTMGTDGFGCPGIAIAAGGFMDITSAVADGIGPTLVPVFGTIVIMIAGTIAVTMIATTTGAAIMGGIVATIGAGVAIKRGQASKRWRSGPA